MLSSHHHAVQFYSNESQLFATVSRFLGEGLISGQPAIVIATRAHREGILDAMSSRYLDVSRAQRTGSLSMLDARDVLSSIMASERPDSDRFEGAIGSLIARVANAHATVRAYGEMVDVLWKAGLSEAALDLEALWNRLAKRHRFALMCGYSVGNLNTQVEQFQTICEQHTHVIGPDAALTRSNQSHDTW